MVKYFGIPYQFDKIEVRKQIDDLVKSGNKGYVCVADGVTMAMSQENSQLKKVLDHAAIIICDSGWVPLYLRMMYGLHKDQYTGTEIMGDLVHAKQYRMMFIGSSEDILQSLKEKLIFIDEKVNGMSFVALPFMKVENFNYAEIAHQINQDDPDVIWVSLGMPKQEIFMHLLEPYLNRGVLIGVGAAFKFHSGLSEYRRAPRWMIKNHLEWLHRIWSEPGKQLSRCFLIIRTMPRALMNEYKSKNSR